MTNGHSYEIIRITEQLRPAADGGVEKFYRHTIRTRGGTVLTVDIPEADFTPEKVEPILKARATNADKILGMKE